MCKLQKLNDSCFYLIIILNHVRLYLGSMESKCKFKQDGISCSGKPKLINIKNYQTSTSNYIIGCDKYKLNDKYHRYIKVDPTTYDVPLLRDLLNGNVVMVSLNLYCILCNIYNILITDNIFYY
jgi:hypothetical protein